MGITRYDEASERQVREIVSNAYRYSHPTGSPVEVTIECGVNHNGEIVIDIGDDGVGLPPEVNLDEPQSMGLRLLHLLVSQLGGVLEVDRSPGKCRSLTNW